MLTIHVLVPVYNGADLLRRCLESIERQDDESFTVTVADDGSTEQAVKAMAEHYSVREGWAWLRSRHNRGATRNLVEAIHTLETTEDIPATDVFLIVDGDDRLAHPGVLARLREVYSDPDVLVSYGAYEADPPDPACPPARPLPLDILRFGMVRAFTRDHGPAFNHPLSFRRAAYDVLREDDFCGPDGEWLRYGYDTTLMVPILEAAGDRAAYVDEVLYVYTSDCSDSVHRIHEEATNRENSWVTGQTRKYDFMVWPQPEPEVEDEEAR